MNAQTIGICHESEVALVYLRGFDWCNEHGITIEQIGLHAAALRVELHLVAAAKQGRTHFGE